MPNLFFPPGRALELELQKAAQAVNRVFPLNNRHRAELPYAVRDLSRMLTSERDQKRGYWSSPRLMGAYLRYFLPWNLLRLGRLLPGLPLELQTGGKLLDLGSGPLTLPLGLWLSRPEARARELSICCSDTAPRPLELGRDILRNLEQAGYGEEVAEGEEGVTAPWKVSLLRAPLEVALRKAGRFNLITAANVLNELPTPRQESLEERLAEVFVSMSRALEPGGQLLLIEPGTRFGGKLVEIMRQHALGHGFEALSPCTHNRECPFLRQFLLGRDFTPGREEDAPGRSALSWQPRPTGWCHFNLDTAGAPADLLRLSAAADLEKERLHLSFVLLRKPGDKQSADKQPGNPATVKKEVPAAAFTGKATAGAKMSARIVSEAIRLPGRGPGARYVCTEVGLGLLLDAAGLPSGAEVSVQRAKGGGVDKKTGAVELVLSK